MVATPQQYRHYIHISKPAEVVEDATGGLIASTPSWSYYGRGRYEENGQANTIKLDDGKTDVYSGIVYCRPGLGKLPKGTRIRVNITPTNGEDIRFEGMVINVNPGEFNARIYVNQQ